MSGAAAQKEEAMDRLTYYDEDGYAVLKRNSIKGRAEAIARLAEYEDIGTPAELRALKAENERLEGAVKEWIDGKCISQKYLTMIGKLQAENERLREELKQAHIHGGKYMEIADERYKQFEAEQARAEKAEAELARYKAENKRLELLCELYGEERSERVAREATHE